MVSCQGDFVQVLFLWDCFFEQVFEDVVVLSNCGNVCLVFGDLFGVIEDQIVLIVLVLEESDFYLNWGMVEEMFQDWFVVVDDYFWILEWDLQDVLVFYNLVNVCGLQGDWFEV